MLEYKKTLEAKSDLNTDESDMLKQINNKVASMDEHIKELERHAEMVELQLKNVQSGNFE